MVLETEPPLPPDKLPKCWSDNVRITALYSSIRPKDVNPLDRIDKISFWKPVIDTWCSHHHRHTFTLDELKRSFLRNGISPACFDAVVEEMMRHRQLMLYSDFTYVPSDSWALWAADVLLKRPLEKTLKAVKETVWPSFFKEEVYVHVASTQAYAEFVWSSITDSQKGMLLELKEVACICQFTGKMKDLEVAIHWLRQQGKAAVTYSRKNGEMLVKFGGTLEKKVSVTEMDMSVYSLKYSEKVLMNLLEDLEKEKKLAIVQARTYVQKDMKHMAKMCLRKKHQLESSITKNSAILDNVQQLLSRIREAESDSKVLESYKIGLTALKMRFKESGLSEDNVADTMSEIEEMLDVQKEVEAALGQTVDGGTESDAELEAELSQLLQLDQSGSDQASPPKVTKGNTSLSFEPEISDDEDSEYKDHEKLDSRLKSLTLSGGLSSSVSSPPNKPRQRLSEPAQ